MIGAPLLIAAMPVGLSMVAVGEQTGWDPTSLIGTAITPVIIVTLFLTGILHGPGEFNRMEADIDRLRDENERLHQTISERVIPAVTRSTLAVESVASLITTEVHLRHNPDG